MSKGKNTTSNSVARIAFKSSIPIMAGYIILGIGFGILLQSNGYGWYWGLLMSVFVYAGSMQYVAVDLLSGGASLITFAVMTLLVNIRHIFYGIAMLKPYENTGKKKPYLIFSLVDETFSLVCSPTIPENLDKKQYYFLVSLFNQLYWLIGTVIGGILGDFLPFNTKGVDFAMTALFTIIFVEQWESSKSHLPAITGVAVSIISLLIFGPRNFLIPAMITITIAMFIEKKFLSGGGKVDK